MSGLTCWIIIAVLAAALLWPGSPAGRAVSATGGALKSTLCGGGGWQ